MENDNNHNLKDLYIEQQPGDNAIISNLLRVHLSKDKAEYFTGEALEGIVELEARSTLLFRGIRVLFHGKEEREGEANHLSNSEDCFLIRESKCLQGNSELSSSDIPNGYHTLEPGKYSWKFKFFISKELPPSVEYQKGKISIRYFLTAQVDGPTSMSVTLPLLIIKSHCLRLYVEPSCKKNCKYIAPLPFINKKTNLVRIQAHLQQNIIKPGDEVKVNVSVSNKSWRKVYELHYSIVQRFYSQNNGKEKSVIVEGQVEKPSLPIKPLSTWTGTINLRFPTTGSEDPKNQWELLPSVQCKSLKVTYEVRLKAVIWPNTSVKVHLPLDVSFSEPKIKSEAPPTSWDEVSKRNKIKLENWIYP